jgi:hypothetical protein
MEVPARLTLAGDGGRLDGWLPLGEVAESEIVLGVIGMSLRPYGTGRTLVSYEARTAIHDSASARRFAWYRLVIRPFAAHIMRAVLTTLRRDAALRQIGRSAEPHPRRAPASRVRRLEKIGGKRDRGRLVVLRELCRNNPERTVPRVAAAKREFRW